ncbi:MAG: prephenate dehydratase [Acidimicrobiales bacterium]
MPRVAFLGPPGTFTEEALLTQPDLAEQELVPMRSMPDVLAAAQSGEADLGFVALENSIEGTVNISLDSLIFEHDLLIRREVVLPVSLALLAPPGTALEGIERVVSFPHATAQCREWFSRHLPGVTLVASNSTAEAAEVVGREQPPATAAVGTVLAAKLYGLEVLAPSIGDHPDNATRFVLVARSGIPAPTGHDKSSIVCFQSADRPGNLHAILGQFAARNINLTKLESRPTKRRLGNYCFVIDLEGHVDDEPVADCLRDLHSQLAGLKFLGSYPAAGEHGPAIRRDAEAAWVAADAWIDAIRGQILSPGEPGTAAPPG